MKKTNVTKMGKRSISKSCMIPSSWVVQGFRVHWEQGKIVFRVQGKNLINSRTGRRNAQEFEHSSSDPIDNEKQEVAIEKQVSVNISTRQGKRF